MAKKNGQAEIVYERGEEVKPDLVAELDEQLAQHGTATYVPPSGPARRLSVVHEAAVLRRDPGKETLYVRLRAIGSLGRILPWIPVCHIAAQELGSHAFRVARKVRAPVSVRQHAALEHAFERARGTNLEDLLARPQEIAEPVQLEAAFASLQSRGKVLYVRFAGLWFGVIKFDQHEVRRADDAQRSRAGQGFNFPRVSIL